MPDRNPDLLSRLLAAPPFAATAEEQRGWLRAVMDCLATKGQPLAKGAGLAPSTINRFLTPGAKHRLRPQTLEAIVRQASALWQADRVGQHRGLGPEPAVLTLPCFSMASLVDGSAHKCAPIYFMPFATAFLRSLQVGDLTALIAVLVGGDAMAPTARSGDQVLVDKACDRLTEDGLYLISAGSARPPLLRRLTLDPDGSRVWVSTDNSAYADAQAVDIEQLAISGRILWIGKRL